MVYAYSTEGNVARQAVTTFAIRGKCSHKHSPCVQTMPFGANAAFINHKRPARRASRPVLLDLKSPQ